MSSLKHDVNIVSKYLPSKYLLQWKRVILQQQHLADTMLLKKSKVISPVMGQMETICRLIPCNEKSTASLGIFGPKTHNVNLRNIISFTK